MHRGVHLGAQDLGQGARGGRELAAREYNETMAKIRADQEASIKETDASRKQEAKDTVSSPKAPGGKTY
jgi:hypothetical protein